MAAWRGRVALMLGTLLILVLGGIVIGWAVDAGAVGLYATCVLTAFLVLGFGIVLGTGLTRRPSLARSPLESVDRRTRRRVMRVIRRGGHVPDELRQVTASTVDWIVQTRWQRELVLGVFVLQFGNGIIRFTLSMGDDFAEMWLVNVLVSASAFPVLVVLVLQLHRGARRVQRRQLSTVARHGY